MNARWQVGVLLAMCLGASRAAKPPVAAMPAYAPATRPATQPSAIPDATAQERALRQVREVYRADYAPAAAGKRGELARTLLERAMQRGEEPAARFVMLREARDLAAAAGMPRLAAAAAQQRAIFYAVDATEELLEAAAVCLRSPRLDRASAAELAEVCISAVDQAVEKDAYAAASRLCALGQMAADRTGSPALSQRCKERASALQSTFLEYKATESARRTIEQRPADPQANQRLGRFLCLVKGQWSEGLGALAKAPDDAVRGAAAADLAAPQSPKDRFALAGTWWDLAEKEKGLAQHRLRMRSAHWYRLAEPGLTGLDRSLARSRINTVEQQRLARAGYTPGFVTTMFHGINFDTVAGRRFDQIIDFDWGEAAPDSALDKDQFSIRFEGILHIDRPGRHEFVVIANLGAKLWVHDLLVLDKPDLSRNRNGVRVAVDLPEGEHPFRLDYWDTGGAARIRLLWRPPGSAKDEPVPAGAFYRLSTGL